ncbi:hypothetical protein ACS0TY_011363 [Phlomoides rotata]
MKYERLPSFYYICGLMGHMKRECDILSGSEKRLALTDESLPFGEWMKESPIKQTTIKTEEYGGTNNNHTLRRRLFEKYKMESKWGVGSDEDTGGGSVPMSIIVEREMTEIQIDVQRVSMHTKEEKIRIDIKGKQPTIQVPGKWSEELR